MTLLTIVEEQLIKLSEFCDQTEPVTNLGKACSFIGLLTEIEKKDVSALASYHKYSKFIFAISVWSLRVQPPACIVVTFVV